MSVPFGWWRRRTTEVAVIEPLGVASEGDEIGVADEPVGLTSTHQGGAQRG